MKLHGPDTNETLLNLEDLSPRAQEWNIQGLSASFKTTHLNGTSWSFLENLRVGVDQDWDGYTRIQIIENSHHTDLCSGSTDNDKKLRTK
jgi:hypothetical protein